MAEANPTKEEGRHSVELMLGMIDITVNKMPADWPFRDALNTLARDIRGGKDQRDTNEPGTLLCAIIACMNHAATMLPLSQTVVKKMTDLAYVPVNYALVFVDVHDTKRGGTDFQRLVLKRAGFIFAKGDYVKFHGNIVMTTFPDEELTDSTTPRFTLKSIHAVSPLFGYNLLKAVFVSSERTACELVLARTCDEPSLVGKKWSVCTNGVLVEDPQGRKLTSVSAVEVPYRW
jgi:hypothetical protein